MLDGDVIEASLSAAPDNTLVSAFCHALALNRQPRLSLHALFQGWIDSLFAFQAACKTGRFAPSDSPASAAARRDALAACARLETEIARLRTAAAREKQMARQVALNLEIKRVEAGLAAAYSKL